MKPSTTSTYRVQFRPRFAFADALPMAEYLERLGASHLYASPIFAARKGSDHGYDCVDMNLVNPELGGEEGFAALSDALLARGIGWIQDIVPNHRCFDGDNPALMDVLENGRASRYAEFYDIFWDHPYENIRGRVLAPFLGDFFGRILEKGELKIAFEPRGFRVRYWDQSFPLRPRSYAAILSLNAGALRREMGSQNQALVKLLGIIRFFENLEEERAMVEDFDPAPAVKRLLWELYEGCDPIRRHIDAAIAEFNGSPGQAESFERLYQVLADQHFRLSYWKVGTEELNYRRFFSINDLICLRVEEERVFEYVHGFVLGQIAAGRMHGLRIDHLDGLYNPLEYLQRLRAGAGDAYIVAEKILEAHEALPADWPIEGTSGYDFLHHANGLFVDPDGEAEIDKAYHDMARLEDSYEEIVLQKKRLIVGKHMAGDIDNLALMLKEVANQYRFGADLTLYSLRRALVEILAQFPVYRTYATPEGPSEADKAILRAVIAKCKESLPILSNELDLVCSYLLDEADHALTPRDRELWNGFLLRLQQYTGPVMAKGVEDTSFFIFNRLTSLNEVGSDPTVFGVAPSEFHEFMHERRAAWPRAMSTTSTHDTKRGEDVRTRISVLSEIPGEWSDALSDWRAANSGLKVLRGRREMPTANDEYAFYQAFLGASPASSPLDDDFPSRVEEFMIKCARESKLVTSWLNEDRAYEDALRGFVRGALDPDGDFLALAEPLRRKVLALGRLNSLSQLVLKLTAVGVPDIYQGTEFWDYSLTDPDNRRPVDYEARKAALDEFEARADDPEELLRGLLESPEDGRVKLFILQRLLRLRRAHPALFLEGGYSAIDPQGPARNHLVAFSRRHAGQMVVVAVGRFFARLHCAADALPLDPEPWRGTALPLPKLASGAWHSVLDGQHIEANSSAGCADLFRLLPVSVLAGSAD